MEPQQVPAVCQRCKAPFMTFVDQRLDPRCPAPRCGGKGTVLQGAYYYAGDSGVPVGFKSVTEVLTRKPPSEQEVASLLALFRAAQANPEKIDREALKAALQQAPRFRTLSDALPETNEGLYGFISMVISLLTALATTAVWTTRAIRRARLKQARAARAADVLRRREAKERTEDEKKRQARLARRARKQQSQSAPAVTAPNPRKQWKPKKPGQS